MKINKRCLSTFSKTKPYLALGTKSKLFDTTFSLTSELSLYDYSTDTHYPTLQLDRKFSKLIWCEKNDKSILATGHDKGMISLYEPDLEGNSFKVLNSFTGLDGDVLGLDYNVPKNVIAAGSANGKIIFWNLDKIDQQYKCDIAINANITTLAWNRKVSRILCAGTDDGRILVLDIRAKNIAMTIENPEIKTVSNLAWHPDCPTSIFASTNMNCLHSFNLSTDSMSTIGEHKVLGFDILNDNTIVSYSKERINYIDVNTQQIRSHEEVDGLFEASFSHRDPLCCLSNSNGFTTISSRRDQSITSRNSQMILNNYLISSQKYKIEYPKMTKTTQNGLSHSLMKLIYQAGKFNLTDTNRKEVANLIYDNCEKEQNGFALSDPVIDKLVKQDFENIESGHKSLDLKFVLNILQKEEIEIQKNDHANGENSVDDLANGDIRVDENACSENTDTEKTTGDYANYKITVNENPIEYLLYLLSTGKYDLVVETLPSSQWKVMISILLFSNYPLEKCFELFKTISNLVVKDEDKLIMFLLTNNPKEILSTSSTTKSAPKSIFDINEFFSNYIPIVEKIKALRIESSDEFLDEFCRYAQDHGLYDLVKDLDLKKQTKSSSKVNLDKINQGKLNQNKINQGKLNLDKMTISSGISNNKEVPKKPVNPPNLYSAASNASVSSFSPSFEKPRTSAFPRVIPSVRQNIRPPANSPPQPVRSSVGSQTILNGSGFHTRPPVKSPLYSCSSSGSTPNFSGNLRQKLVPGTYGSENLSGTYGSESIPTPKTPPLPHSGVKNTIPKPGQSFTRPSKLPQSTETNYDKVGLSADFEKVYERLREEASKKNNLIIGNKIKDANRRFSVFQNLDKLSLTNEVLSKMNLIIQTFNDVTERDLLRQSVKVIIEDCIDVHENQCNIWMPAIYTLVQLVY